jgi:Tol biopolymer transport system component
MGATGESIRRLTREGCNPAWSPDGEEIAYTTECFESPLARASTSSLWIAPAAGGEPRRIYAGDAVQARFSPNGQRLAFWGVREGSGERDIWTVDVNGGEPILVTEQGPVDWNPVWSPDGRFLYYSSDRDGNMNLWRIPIDQKTGAPRGRPQPVTTGVGAWSQNASLSSDGRHIAYSSKLFSENLQKVSFDPATGRATGEPQWISRGSISLNDCSPSADEQWIVCQMAGKQEDIAIMRADGSERRQLTDDPYKDRGPRWLPGGDEIVFYSDRSGSYEIWAINEDGSGLRQLTDTPGMSTIWPVLSPDGKRLLYQNLRTNEAQIKDFAPASSRSQTDRPQPETIETGNTDRWLGPLSWSPDGRVLAGLIIDPNGRMDGIGTYDLTSGSYVELAAEGGTPVWLSDSRRVVYPEGSVIRLMDVRTGESHPILSVAPDSIETYSLQLSTDDRTIYFTRDASASDIWLLTLE